MGSNGKETCTASGALYGRWSDAQGPWFKRTAPRVALGLSPSQGSPVIDLFEDATRQALHALQEGRRLRDEGLAKVSQGNAEFLAETRSIAKQLCEHQGTVTAEDVRREYQGPDPTHPNAWGAVFKDKAFEWTGHYKQSGRAERHANTIRIWRLRQADSASTHGVQ